MSMTRFGKLVLLTSTF